MKPHADILVTGANDTTQLVVEVKPNPDASPEWAKSLRRNLLSAGVVPDSPFFMIATPRRFFLWNGEESKSDGGPNYVIETSEALEPYFGRDGEPRIAYSLELVLKSWLRRIMRTPETELGVSLSWLVDSGLYHAIRNGDIRAEATV